jgi:hypothetical protein
MATSNFENILIHWMQLVEMVNFLDFSYPHVTGKRLRSSFIYST